MRLLGFRSNKTWKKIISIAYLVILSIFFVAIMFEGKYENIQIKDFVISKISNGLIFLFFLSPYIFLSQTKLRDKILIFNKRKIWSNIIGFIIVFILTIFLNDAINKLHTKEYLDDMENHAYKEITVEATCEKSGEVKQLCEYCGKSEIIQTIPALGHNMKVILDDGSQLVKECEICKKQEVIKKSNNIIENDKSSDINNKNDMEKNDIPQVVGLDYATAKVKLEELNIDFEVKFTYNNSFKTNCNAPVDTVVAQSLQGKVEKDNHLALVVAKPSISVSQINLDTNYVGGINTTIFYKNLSDKQIAYIYFNIKYYDRMGNPAYCSITNSPTARLEFTGPLNANQNNEAYWDAVIYNSATAVAQPQKIKIIFTDGTSQTIINSGAYWYTNSYYGGELHN